MSELVDFDVTTPVSLDTVLRPIEPCGVKESFDYLLNHDDLMVRAAAHVIAEMMQSELEKSCKPGSTFDAESVRNTVMEVGKPELLFMVDQLSDTEIESAADGWLETNAYWSCFESQCVEIVRYGLRAKWTGELNTGESEQELSA